MATNKDDNTVGQEGDNLCAFAPKKKEDAVPEDEILFRKPRTYEELIASSDRCCAHVNERLDQIEEEINASAKSDK